MRIRDFYNNLMGKVQKICKDKEVREMDIINHLSSYNTNVLLMFDALENVHLTRTSFVPQNPQAMHLPKPIKHSRIQNSLSDIIQFCISEERFRLDGRSIRYPGALAHDINVIEKIINRPLKDLKDADMIRLHSLMRSQTTSSKYGIGYSGAADKSVMIFLLSWMTDGIEPRHKYHVLTNKSISVEHPITGELLFERDFGMHTNFSNIFIENLTQWYYYTVVKEGKSIQWFREFISTMKIEQK